MFKNVVVPLECEYLQRVAKQFGISRTRLVRLLMEKIIRDERASELLTADDVAADISPPRYRRFHNETAAP